MIYADIFFFTISLSYFAWTISLLTVALVLGGQRELCSCCRSFPSLAMLCEAYEKWAEERNEIGRRVKAISVGYIAFSEGHSIKTTYGNSFLWVAA